MEEDSAPVTIGSIARGTVGEELEEASSATRAGAINVGSAMVSLAEASKVIGESTATGQKVQLEY